MAGTAWEVFSCDFCSQRRLTSVHVLTQFCRLCYYLTAMSISMSLTKSEVSNCAGFEAFGQLFQEQSDHLASVCFFVPFKEEQRLLVFSYQILWAVLSAGCEITCSVSAHFPVRKGSCWKKIPWPWLAPSQGSQWQTHTPFYLAETLRGWKRSFYPTWLCTHILMNETTAFSLPQNIIEKS